jgi:HEAT repeat protein
VERSEAEYEETARLLMARNAPYRAVMTSIDEMQDDGTPNAVNALRSGMRSPHGATATRCLKALAAIGTEEALAVLVEALWSDDIWTFRLAAREISKREPRAIRGDLLRCLEDRGDELSTEQTHRILNGLVPIADRRAIPVFRRYGTHEHWRVRFEAIRGLARLRRNPDAIEAVRAINAELPFHKRMNTARVLRWARLHANEST